MGKATVVPRKTWLPALALVSVVLVALLGGTGCSFNATIKIEGTNRSIYI